MDDRRSPASLCSFNCEQDLGSPGKLEGPAETNEDVTVTEERSDADTNKHLNRRTFSQKGAEYGRKADV